MDILLAGPSHFDYEAARTWVHDRRGSMLQLVGAYLLGLYLCKRAMTKRPAMDLRVPLIVWNLALTIFSCAGCAVVWIEFIDTWRTFGFTGTYCQVRDFFHGHTGYWVWLFTVSKCVELGDSFFLVFRKRPLSFLQWYHHALTLAYCWTSYTYEPVFNRIGTLMNYTVHSLMYMYFLLRALQIRVPSFVAQQVTTIQIVQFVIAASLLVHGTFRVRVQGAICDWPLTIDWVALAMNASYLVLFVDFFVRAYWKKQHSTFKKQA